MRPTTAVLIITAWLFSQCGPPAGNHDPFNRREEHIIYTRHARCRMDCRHISQKEIREILEKGVINYAKSEPEARPDPKYALDGYTQEGQHLRVVFGTATDGLVVITCIDLEREWACECP